MDSPRPTTWNPPLRSCLPPGRYTAIVTGKNNQTGIGLIEIYDEQYSEVRHLADCCRASSLAKPDIDGQVACHPRQAGSLSFSRPLVAKSRQSARLLVLSF